MWPRLGPYSVLSRLHQSSESQQAHIESVSSCRVGFLLRHCLHVGKEIVQAVYTGNPVTLNAKITKQQNNKKQCWFHAITSTTLFSTVLCTGCVLRTHPVLHFESTRVPGSDNKAWTNDAGQLKRTIRRYAEYPASSCHNSTTTTTTTTTTTKTERKKEAPRDRKERHNTAARVAENRRGKKARGTRPHHKTCTNNTHLQTQNTVRI